MKLLLLFSILALSGKSSEVQDNGWINFLPPATDCNNYYAHAIKVNQEAWQRCSGRI